MLDSKKGKKSSSKRRKELQQVLWLADLCGGELFEEFCKEKEEKHVRKYFFQQMITTLNKLECINEETIKIITQFIKDTPIFHNNPPKKWFFSESPRYSIEIDNEKIGTNKSTMLAVNSLNTLSNYLSGLEKMFRPTQEAFTLLKNNYPTDFIPEFIGGNVKISLTESKKKSVHSSGRVISGSEKNLISNNLPILFLSPSKSSIRSSDKRVSKKKTVSFSPEGGKVKPGVEI